jgi:hypothetical protein
MYFPSDALISLLQFLAKENREGSSLKTKSSYFKDDDGRRKLDEEEEEEEGVFSSTASKHLLVTEELNFFVRTIMLASTTLLLLLTAWVWDVVVAGAGAGAGARESFNDKWDDKQPYHQKNIGKAGNKQDETEVPRSWSWTRRRKNRICSSKRTDQRVAITHSDPKPSIHLSM